MGHVGEDGGGGAGGISEIMGDETQDRYNYKSKEEGGEAEARMGIGKVIARSVLNRKNRHRESHDHEHQGSDLCCEVQPEPPLVLPHVST